MKSSIYIIFLLLLNFNAFTQSELNNRQLNAPIEKPVLDSTVYDLPDGYLFKDGKMLVIKNGHSSDMNLDVTLVDGTLVKINGQYLKKGDGITKNLKEGEHIDLSGKITLIQRLKRS